MGMTTLEDKLREMEANFKNVSYEKTWDGGLQLDVPALGYVEPLIAALKHAVDQRDIWIFQNYESEIQTKEKAELLDTELLQILEGK